MTAEICKFTDFKYHYLRAHLVRTWILVLEICKFTDFSGHPTVKNRSLNTETITENNIKPKTKEKYQYQVLHFQQNCLRSL